MAQWIRFTLSTKANFLIVISLIGGLLLTLLATQASAAGSISPLQKPGGINAEKVILGKDLFHDVRLSGNQNISCASCHSMDKAGADGLSLSPGTEGQLTRRNTPTVLNSSLNISQFWDGRADTLEEQVDAVINDPIEMGADWPTIIGRLSADEVLRSKMAVLYQPAISKASVTDVLKEYMSALVTVDSAFDQYLRGDELAISAEARQGYELFKSIGCISCHQGANVGGNLYQRAGVKIPVNGRVDSKTTFASDLGRFAVTGRERDKFVFRVPSLRNVALTAPYFHNGRVASLDEAIAIMARSQLGKDIPGEQISLIREFLISLNGYLPEALQ